MRQIILYSLTLSVVMILYQLGVWYFQHSQFNLVSAIFLTPVFALVWWFKYEYLSQQYGFLRTKRTNRASGCRLQVDFLVDVATYFTVFGSFLLHVLMLMIYKPGFTFNTVWIGALFGLGGVWGLVLFIEALRLVANTTKFKVVS